MSYTTAHGPPARDATHQWAPAAGTPPPVLGDTHKDTLVLPQTVIDNIANWRGRPEIIHNSAPRTFGSGEIFYPERRLGKTLVYEMRMQADDREEFLLTQNALVQGFIDPDIGTMTVTPWPFPGGVVWTYTAKVLDLAEGSNWELDGVSGITYEWRTTLTLRMDTAKFNSGAVSIY